MNADRTQTAHFSASAFLFKKISDSTSYFPFRVHIKERNHYFQEELPMCGIGGFVDFERDARRGGPILHGMKRTLTPRGRMPKAPILTRTQRLSIGGLSSLIRRAASSRCTLPTGIPSLYITESYITHRNCVQNLCHAGTSSSDIRTLKCYCTPILSGKPTHFRG